jgi:hypothetical protein
MLASYFTKKSRVSKNNNINSTSSGDFNISTQEDITGEGSSGLSFSFAFLQDVVDETAGSTPSTTAATSTINEHRGFIEEKKLRLPQPISATQRRRARRKKVNNNQSGFRQGTTTTSNASTQEKVQKSSTIISECAMGVEQKENRNIDPTLVVALCDEEIGSRNEPKTPGGSDDAAATMTASPAASPSKYAISSPPLSSSTIAQQLKKKEVEKKKKQRQHQRKKVDPRSIARMEKQPKPISKVVQRSIGFNSNTKSSAMVNKSSLLVHCCQKQQQQKQEEHIQETSSPFTFGFDICI